MLNFFQCRFAVSQFTKKKLPSPGTRLKHGAKRREKVSWKEKEEQLNPNKSHGSRRYVNEDDISCSNIVQGTSRQYQIQRLKRDAPGKYQFSKNCANGSSLSSFSLMKYSIAKRLLGSSPNTFEMSLKVS